MVYRPAIASYYAIGNCPDVGSGGTSMSVSPPATGQVIKLTPKN